MIKKLEYKKRFGNIDEQTEDMSASAWDMHHKINEIINSLNREEEEEEDEYMKNGKPQGVIDIENMAGGSGNGTILIPTESEWEKSFDERYGEQISSYGIIMSDIKQFIKSQLSLQKQTIVKEIEKWAKENGVYFTPNFRDYYIKLENLSTFLSQYNKDK